MLCSQKIQLCHVCKPKTPNIKHRMLFLLTRAATTDLSHWRQQKEVVSLCPSLEFVGLTQPIARPPMLHNGTCGPQRAIHRVTQAPNQILREIRTCH